MVRLKGLEPSRPFGHSDLNAARLPIPPQPHCLQPQQSQRGKARIYSARRGKGKPLKRIGNQQDPVFAKAAQQSLSLVVGKTQTYVAGVA